MDSYIISYSFTITGCYGVVGTMDGDTVAGISGSERTYSLTDLEENAQYIISISAINGAGTSPMSPMTVTNTLVTGNCLYI